MPNRLIVSFALILFVMNSIHAVGVDGMDGTLNPGVDTRIQGFVSREETLPELLNGVRGTLLNDRFGVSLALQAPWGGGSYNSFDTTSFVPTKNLATVEWVEADWYGEWNMSNFNHTDIRGQYPSGTEYYDVEALYFDNDDVNLYVAIVTSCPHLADWGGGNVGVGIYESRISPGVWIRPGDLSLDLGLNSPRVERNGTTWSYDYGVDITHEDRDQLPGLYTMRDNFLGASFYRTQNDAGGTDVENPNDSDWYTSGLNHNTTAYWEHTSFDPFGAVSQGLGVQYIGETTVSYYEYAFPGGALENNASTYIIEVTIPRVLFGLDNPAPGDTVGIRWVMGCRNDGNSNDAVVKLDGIIDGPLEDFGDAPDPSYPTVIASNGARHTIDGVTFLGAGVDAEADGQPDTGALGDDNDGNDDEDGVLFTTALTPGSSAGVNVVASVGGLLNAWIDFNGNGSWADAGDQIFTNQALSPGLNSLTFPVPAGAVSGVTYARFRFGSESDLSFDGSSPDGEVEDYRLDIGDVDLDFGDVPDPTFPTLRASDGARHIIDGSTYLGAGVDADTDGQPDPGAVGDDNDGNDDEDGVVFTSAIQSNTIATVTVTASVAGVLNAWMDFGGNGDWDGMGEQIFTDRALVAGSNNLSFVVPAGATAGSAYSRFRFSTTGGLGYAGSASDGEVEDYVVEIERAFDFGDAPEPNYPTYLASDGARHIIDGVLYLGTNVDAEPDGQPASNALGDDTDGNDDEDGVSFPTLIPGRTVTINVRASAAGLLSAWIDYDRNNSWAEAGEEIFTDRTLVAGLNALTVTIPTDATPGQTYTRFRFSTAGGLTYTGSAENGEVEDYRVTMQTAVDWGDSPDSPYPTQSANGGARHTIDWSVYLGSTIDGETNGQQSIGADGDDNNGSDDEDGVVFTTLLVPGLAAGVDVTASVPGFLNTWIDFDGNGSWADAGEQIFTDEPLAAGVNSLSFTVPADALSDTAYARFRFDTIGGLTYTGSASDGEVEDYLVLVQQSYDFGDVPDPSYPTLRASDGARHILDGMTYLGAGVDEELDGQPDVNALGDDTGSDDEDGVVFTSPIISGQNATVDVTASSTGYLNAWVDFNNNGNWDDGGETIFTDESLNAGLNSLSFAVPAGAPAGVKYARFRFDTGGGLSYDGIALDGEVEDYVLSVDVPVELSSFSAEIADGLVQLSWTTQSEEENLGFNIYRAVGNETAFSLLNDEIIPGAGNSTTPHEYRYMDKDVQSDMTYRYILEDIAFDGTETRHGPLEIRVEGLPEELSIEGSYPSPIRDSGSISLALPKSGSVRLSLYDLSGRRQRILMDEYRESGYISIPIDRLGESNQRLHAGLYILRLVAGNENRSMPIVFVD